MKRTMTVTVDAPAHLNDKRVAFLLKGLLQNGVQLCESIVDAADSETDNESEAISIEIKSVKAAKKPHIAVFVSGGVVTDVYSTIKRLKVTLVDHDNGEQDDDVAEENQKVVERLAKEFPYSNF